MRLIVSTAPHWRQKLTVSEIHTHFIVALLPAVLFSVYMYGIHAARVICLSIFVAVLSEIGIRKLFKKTATVTDGSAFLIGLLFALLLPPSFPYWIVILGSFLCIFIGKEIFGGLGSNPLNPVLVGWAITRISWPSYFNFDLAMVNYDLGFSTNYPLGVLKQGGAEFLDNFDLFDLLLGKQVGGMGAAPIILLLIGGLYLVCRKLIAWEIPFSFLFGVLALSFIFQLADSSLYADPLFHVVTGNIMLGAFFLSTDYASSPFTRWGMLVFGLGCGVLTVIFRVWSVYPDGVVFAILIVSLFTPILDKLRHSPKMMDVFFIDRKTVGKSG